MARTGDEPDAEALVRTLEEAGYRVLRRQSGWHECLLERDDERWHGTGHDAEAALLDALNRALPSHLARLALAGWIGRETAMAERARDARPAPSEPELPFAAGPSPPAAASSTLAPEPATASEEPALVGEAPVAWETPPASEAARGQGRVFQLHQEEAIEMLEELEQEIRATVDEAALWAPERQRLLILKWIGFARGVQDQSRAKGIESRVYAIAQDLGRLAKIWWPGSVPALQLTAEPSACRHGLALEPRTWGEVAEAATERLLALLDSDESQGLGEQGWADDANLDPPPADPDSDLRSIARKLEELTGPLDHAPPPRDLRELGEGVLEDARQWAEKLRWMRGSVEDSWTWGAAFGRLRWMSWGFGRRTPLVEVLDPSFRPLRTWAQYLGYDPQKKEKVKQKNQILKSFPGDNGSADRDELLGWLHRALECELLSSERLAEMLEPHRGVLGELGPDSLPGLERRHRKKLRKLRARLGGEAAAEALSAETEEEEQEEDRDEPASGAAGRTQPLDERLLGAVRASVAGRRALLVTNRADPDLDLILEQTFGFASVEHCEHSDRRIQSAAKRIVGGSYDFVLSATGFQPHKVDAKLRKACVDADIPYVRVNRARRQACLRALARELGLLQQHGLAS